MAMYWKNLAGNSEISAQFWNVVNMYKTGNMRGIFIVHVHMRVCTCVHMYSLVCICVHVYVRACVRACVIVCVRVEEGGGSKRTALLVSVVQILPRPWEL